MLTLNTLELKKQVQEYKEKNKVCERLLSVKTKSEENLQTQVIVNPIKFLYHLFKLPMLDF